MKAVLYLFFRQQINTLKRTFSRPASAVITVLVSFFFLMGPVVMIVSPQKGLDLPSLECVVSAVPLFFGILLMNVFLSQKSGLFTLADACFLFVSPVGSRSILAYAVFQTAPASLLTALFLSFYFPYLIGSAADAAGFAAIFIETALLFCCIYIFYYFVYLADIARSGVAKVVRTGLWVLIFAAALAFFLVLRRRSFSFPAAAQAFFGSPFYSAVPVFGWTKWGIMSVLHGDYLTGYLPATLLLILFSAGFGYAMVNIKSEFYEKALEDSYKIQKIKDARTGRSDQRSLLKIRRSGVSVKFGFGASAIFSRQWLEMKKTSPFVTFRDLIICVFYSVFALVIGMHFPFAFIMILFMSLAGSINDTWHLDFKKPYVYLIPDSSFRKIIYSVLAGLLKSVVSGTISVTAAAVLFRLPPAETAAYLLLYTAFAVLFVASEVFTYRIMGSTAGVSAVMFLRMLFVMLAMIPSGIALVVILVLNNGNLSILIASPVVFTVNILFSAVLFYFSRKLFENSELMS